MQIIKQDFYLHWNNSSGEKSEFDGFALVLHDLNLMLSSLNSLQCSCLNFDCLFAGLIFLLI